MYIKRSIKFNVIARSVVGFAELAFSLFCFPYVAKKLDPSTLGQVDFVNSTVAYFVTLSAFGIAEYGSREVALHRNVKTTVNNLLINLFQISILISLLVFLFYLGVIVPFFGNGSILFIYSSFLIITTCFNLVWALEGLEDFAFLAYAKIFSKICFVAYLILFIKSKEDVNKYFLGMMFFDFLYFLFSFLRLKFKYEFSFNIKSLFKKPNLVLIPGLFQIFLMILIQSSIAGVPSIFMGKLNFLEDLGQMATAQRFFWIGYYAIIPLMTVLLSRSMSFSHDHEADRRKSHLDTTALALISLCVPISIGMICIADNIIPLLVGAKYFKAIFLLKILAPLITLYSLNNFWSMQVVFSFKGDRTLIKANLIGFIAIVLLSLYFIPKFSAVGAISVMNLTHLLLFIIFYSYGKKFYQMTDIIYDLGKVVLAGLVMFLAIYSFNAINFYLLGGKILSGIVVYFITLLVLRHKLALQALNIILRRN